MRLYSAELTDAPTFQSFPLQSLIQADISAQIVLVPSDQDGVWLGDGHTHWLLTVQGGDVSVSSELGGVPVVGNCDATSNQDGVESDVRIEGGLDALIIAHHKNGEREVGGVYTLSVDRGYPLLVSWVYVPWSCDASGRDSLGLCSTTHQI